jgi:hypothetical protein
MPREGHVLITGGHAARPTGPTAAMWLPGRDSNPDRQIQSLLSYH